MKKIKFSDCHINASSPLLDVVKEIAKAAKQNAVALQMAAMMVDGESYGIFIEGDTINNYLDPVDKPTVAG